MELKHSSQDEDHSPVVANNERHVLFSADFTGKESLLLFMFCSIF
jgi:hypothetical protein